MMQAARLFGTGDMRVVSVPDPVPGQNEVLIRIAAAGICGTDRHLFKGEFPCNPPVTLGHEFSGTVIANGPGADLALGALVTCDPNIACGVCDPCRRGRVNLCQNNIAIGIHRDGGFAEFACIPANRAFPFPAGIDPAFAAFSEPLACTLHGMDMGAAQPGERVIILGGGVIGMLALQLAACAGAEVMLVTRQLDKRTLAQTLGARETAGTHAEALRIWPQGAELVVECAGVAETVAMAPALTRAGGRIVILGVLPQGERVAIEPFDLLFREIQVLFSFLNPFTQSRAAAMIAAGQIAIAPLISRTIPLSEAPRAIANPPLAGEIKVIVVPG